MEWERAKKILIILLAILNAVLFVLNTAGSQKYRVSTEDMETIKSILAAQEITVNCDLPADYEPMHLAAVSPPSIEYDYLEECFFSANQEIIRTNESGNVIYQSGENSLTMLGATLNKPNNAFIYHAVTSEKTANMPADAISEYAHKLLGQRFSKFSLTHTFPEAAGIVFLYNEKVKDKPFFCSYLRILVRQDGSFTITAQKYDFSSYTEGSHEIFRIDEALLSFMHYAADNLKKPLVIEKVDLGYDMDSTPVEDEHKSKPYYRIFVEGIHTPFYIDAFTNTVIQETDDLVL